MTAAAAVERWRGVDRDRFEREIVPRGEPAVLEGAVAGWPVVRLAQQSDAALAEALVAMDSGSEVDALMVPPGRQGRIFFADDFDGFNYLHNRLPLSHIVEQLMRYARFAEPPAVAVQSALVSRCLPSFAAQHRLALLPVAVEPRLWLGNAVRTPTHFDESSNLACVVAGRRRFTFFPPEQIGNLYVGPIGHAPGRTPICFTDPDEPDLERYPRYAEALRHARQATLGPGDAVYIPPLWWHHVASLAPLNLLVNYWWQGAAEAPSSLDALVHAIAALGAMPPAQRQAWRAMFAHWVFDVDETTFAHIPPSILGLHGRWTPELAQQLRRLLRERLSD